MDKLKYKPKRKTEFWGIRTNDNVEISRDKIYTLNPIASYIWKLCDGTNSISTIAYNLANVCNALNNLEQIRNDVLEILEAWKKEGLLILDFKFFHSAHEYNSEQIYSIKANTSSPVDILLLTAPTPTPLSYAIGVQLEPLGLGYLSSYLKSQGFCVAIADLWYTQLNSPTIMNLITEYDPKVIGVSTMTDNFGNGIKIAKVVKEYNKNIKIIFGGVHVTFRDYEAMINHSEIDIVVRGEGEDTLLELAEFYLKSKGELSSIDGITYRNDNKLVRTKDRGLIQSLDILPFPDRINPDINVDAGVQTSRGCPGQCIFCSAAGLSGGKYRKRTAINVVKEIESLLCQGISRIFFQDDTITVDLKRLHDILDLIEGKSLKFNWTAESRVDIVEKDTNIFKRMASNGCVSLQFGIESGSQEILNALKKNIKISQIYNAIKSAVNSGILPKCSFLIGHPFDNPETIEQTVEFAKKLIDIGAECTLAIVCPYPGSDIAEKPELYGLKIKCFNYLNYNAVTPVMDTKYLTQNEIRTYYYKYSMDLHRYGKKK